jgi:GntR family transcriptional regulator, vanillate catabolism transcriptional regulator
MLVVDVAATGSYAGKVAPPTASSKDLRLPSRNRLVDDVTNRLRDLILSHQLPPGLKLLQTELAEQFGVSRTPLREAIRLLEYDGLVRVSNGNRTVEVVEFSRDDLRELYEIREVIDGLAARLLAGRDLQGHVDAALTRSLAVIAESVYPLHGKRLFAAHLEFHSVIVQHSGNSQLLSHLALVRLTAASLRDEFPAAVRSLSRSPDEAEKRARVTVSEHQRIYDAIRSGDGDEAEREARCHIRGTIDRYLSPEDTGEQLQEEAVAGRSA